MVNGEINYFTFSKVAWRYFFRILFGIVLCIVMYGTFFSFFDAAWYQRLLSVLTLALLVYMLYTGMWSVGVHDKDEVFFQRMKMNPLRGLSVSGVVSIPYFILNLSLMLICVNTDSDKNFDMVRLIFNLINAPFLFINLATDYHNIGSAIIAGIFLPLTIIGIGGLSYYLGLKNISILQLSVYKDEKDKNEENK
ncbi:MAG TPA: hypothetical protein PK629_02595 [Oscillospiraceae bacterium]|nr:hypothetical protein [Oscillospiraceae bacterium]HPK34214.1 hypothetical protein [Oscillospiraceae bacterium]HPR74883.1 hypothetical protein [Oscillospiraceae bacterium]